MGSVLPVDGAHPRNTSALNASYVPYIAVCTYAHNLVLYGGTISIKDPVLVKLSSILVYRLHPICVPPQSIVKKQ
jgi:hypothetical protein